MSLNMHCFSPCKRKAKYRKEEEKEQVDAKCANENRNEGKGSPWHSRPVVNATAPNSE